MQPVLETYFQKQSVWITAKKWLRSRNNLENQVNTRPLPHTSSQNGCGPQPPRHTANAAVGVSKQKSFHSRDVHRQKVTNNTTFKHSSTVTAILLDYRIMLQSLQTVFFAGCLKYLKKNEAYHTRGSYVVSWINMKS